MTSGNRAIFEAFDGVELRLRGRVVKVPDLSVAEAMHFLRLIEAAEEEMSAGDEDGRAVFAFVRDFVPRAGLVDVTAYELGVTFTGELAELDALGQVKAGDAVALVETLIAAQAGEPRAQLSFLEAFPLAAGKGEELGAARTFELGGAFALTMYNHMYGLAQSFLEALISAPAIRVLSLRGATPGTAQT